MKYVLALVSILFASSVHAHEWTPTYPKLKSHYLDGIIMTTMYMFNKRNDVQFYEISVFDEEWNNLSFATNQRVFQIKYLERKQIEIYFRSKDEDKITYICTESKMLKEDSAGTNVKSRICSKIKR